MMRLFGWFLALALIVLIPFLIWGPGFERSFSQEGTVAWLTAYGQQGHSAYPERAKNPLPALVRLLDRLASHTLDNGTEHFGPSTLAITTIDVGNPASNVIPAEARATVNIRFNDAHSGASLILATERSEVGG